MSIEVEKIISENLQKARVEAGYSLRQLSDVVGYAGNTLHNWEHGRRSITAEALAKIAQATGKPVAWFFGEASALDSASAPPGNFRCPHCGGSLTLTVKIAP